MNKQLNVFWIFIFEINCCLSFANWILKIVICLLFGFVFWYFKYEFET